jgi:DNA-binding FadR family transcriptional regulator
LIYQLISKGDVDAVRETMRQHLTFEPDWIFSILDSRRQVTGGNSASSNKKIQRV